MPRRTQDPLIGGKTVFFNLRGHKIRYIPEKSVFGRVVEELTYRLSAKPSEERMWAK
ncbi:MAG: hypothetical protein K0Q90_4256 [Paenibacillaceae bacterium]|jgi:hypothetical protein|nr:hypothetical protein [Paenibacillaceae bacterium]